MQITAQSSSIRHSTISKTSNNARTEKIAFGSRRIPHQFGQTSSMAASVRLSPRHGRHSLQVVAAVKKITARNIACSKTLVAVAGQETAVESLCQEVTAYSKRQMSDRSSGILSFDCSRDGGDTNVFHFWEVYESNVTMGRHNTTPEVESFMNKVKPLLESPVGMVLYEMKDGKLGPASVQGGPRGEGGLDDATGATGAAGGASYKQTSGTVDLSKSFIFHSALFTVCKLLVFLRKIGVI